jgi:hypothetical protein
MSLEGVVQACNPSTWETEVGGLCVQGQHGLHKEDPLSENRNEKTNNKKKIQ